MYICENLFQNIMKKLSVFILLCAGISLSAQNIISTRPANAPDGKILTMEETILSRKLNPTWVNHKWENTANQEFPKEILKGQSLYVAKAEGDTIAVAVSENKQITYGQTVSRNEFGISGGIFWSPDKSKLAFYRKDESKVTTFPLLDITTRTGSLVEIKYPMAGMDSENVQLGIYDIATGNTIYANVDEFGYDQYLTNISWSPDASKIFIQVLDRSQKHVKLNMYDANDGSFIKTILTEDNDRFVEPQDPIHFISGSQNLFIYRTDNRDCYRNLYLCDLDGNVRRLTCVDADVKYVANNGKYIWYTSAEVSPIENHLFRVSVKVPKTAAVKGAEVVKIGKPERLTTEPGWHTITMSPDLTQYTDVWSSLTVPRIGNLCSADGKVIKNIFTAEDPTLEHAYTEISLGTVKSADGKYDNYFRMIKPLNFDPTKKYPTIVYVYGGPHSQMVQNTFMGNLRRWEMYMAQRGYLVYVQDNRGTQNRGSEFEKAIHKQCGQAEMADQMEGVKMLMSLPYVDADRIGIHGWSYGGFMTISLITNYPEVFKVAVAGGPVIDWKWYEVMYGERYMDNPAVNPEGYAKTSLINKAKNLKGKLLICQGTIDPVVVWEHSLSFIRECIKNNVQVDYFPYPCAEHNVMGKDRVHLHDKISMYFEDYL